MLPACPGCGLMLPTCSVVEMVRVVEVVRVVGVVGGGEVVEGEEGVWGLKRLRVEW